MAGCAFLLVKVGQQCPIACKLALCSEQLRACCGTYAESPFHQLNVLRVVLDDALKGRDLGMHSRHRQCLCRDIGSQGKISRVQLIALIFRICGFLLDRALLAAE